MLKTILGFGITIIALLLFIPIGSLAFILSLLGLRKPMSWAVYKIVKTWARCIVSITGCKAEIVGRNNIPMQGGVCFVSNHVGIFDIVFALAFIDRPFGFIAKKELLYFPFLNIAIFLIGCLFIDRKSIKKAMKTIERGTNRLRNGDAILIFPEGTRSKGMGLLPFRPGALKLATNSLVPIIPMAISGSYEVFERDFRVHPVPVRIVFCPPINTAEMSPDERRHGLLEQVRSSIDGALVKF